MGEEGESKLNLAVPLSHTTLKAGETNRSPSVLFLISFLFSFVLRYLSTTQIWIIVIAF